MGRLLGSKNKRKCFITLSNCLTAQVEVQDEEHLYRENHTVGGRIKKPLDLNAQVIKNLL